MTASTATSTGRWVPVAARWIAPGDVVRVGADGTPTCLPLPSPAPPAREVTVITVVQPDLDGPVAVTTVTDIWWLFGDEQVWMRVGGDA